MKTSSVCLLLGVSVLLPSGPTVSAVSLSVSPNLQQIFSRDSNLTLRCDEDGQKADGRTVKRTTRGGGGETKQCGNDTQDFGRIKDSFCIVSPLLPASDSGVYWCETSSGEKSEQINITVTDGPMILEIPALPVLTGSDVTLRCRFRDGVRRPADVLKNGRKVTSDPTGEFNISNVQQSHEGFYSCAGQTAEYPRSRLRVKASPTPPPSSSFSPPLPTSPSSSGNMTVLAVLGSLVLLVLLLVAVLLLWRKHTGKTDSCPPADSTYADITIAAATNRREKHPEDPETIYSGVNTHTAGSSSSERRKRRSKRDRHPDPLYSAATPPPGADDVTYSQVVIGGQGSDGVRPAQPDVVYSSLRSGK